MTSSSPRLDGPNDQRPIRAVQGDTPTAITFRNVWRQPTDDVAEDVVQFWTAHRLLPAGVDPAERLSELSHLAYHGDRLVGVSTITVAPLPQVRRTFGFFRCSVDPEFRHHYIAAALTEKSGLALQDWSKQFPEHDVAGLAVIVQSPDLAPIAEFPMWMHRDSEKTTTGLTLIGYTPAGHQLRIAWFSHTRV